MKVFLTAQRSSETEVVGDLLWTVLANQYGDEVPQHIPTTAKSVLILYVHAEFGIVDHTVKYLHRYRPWQAETATVLACRLYKSLIFFD